MPSPAGRAKAGKIFRRHRNRPTRACLVCSCVRRRPRVFVDHATLHDEIDMLQSTDVSQRIGVDGDDVGVFAGFNRAHVLGAADQIGGIRVAARIACDGVMPYFTM